MREIKEMARQHGVPLVENKPLAQALFKAVHIGAEIPEELFRAVAEVLAESAPAPLVRVGVKDQFGTSGCVGCGRCITWCPVGIDITAEARALRQGDAQGSRP